eukprot:15441124-Alexandrium_andersonii.AAC.1
MRAFARARARSKSVSSHERQCLWQPAIAHVRSMAQHALALSAWSVEEPSLGRQSLRAHAWHRSCDVGRMAVARRA